MVIAYVGDIVAVGEQEQVDKMKSALDVLLYAWKTSGVVPAQCEEELKPLKFLGCSVERTPSEQIIMHQQSYIDHCQWTSNMLGLMPVTSLPAVDEKSLAQEATEEQGKTDT